jgi:hypothetical protein
MVLIASAPPKRCFAYCHLARTAPATRPLRLATFTTQNAFDWLHPDLAIGSDFLRINEMLARLLPGHPFTHYSHPPVTVMGCRSLLRVIRTSTEALTDSTKIPVANLCN